MLDVLLTTNYSPWSRYSGGGQKSTHMLACAYARMGLRVAVIYTKAPWERVQPPPDQPYRIEWACFVALRPGISSIFRWLNGFFVWHKARKLCSGSTTLIGSGDEASLLGFLRDRRAFVYCNRYPNPHAWLSRVPWNSLTGWLYVGFREPRYWAMALAVRGADRIACTSNDSLRQFRQAFPMGASKARMVPNGIDPVFLQSPLPEVLGSGILYYGRLTIGKGIRELLIAYNNLPEATQARHPLVLVGQGPLLSEVTTAYATNPRIRHLPWLSSLELASLMRTQRLVVLPSHEESFGNTMLESLAMGMDLLTCHAGSIPEVVQDQATLVTPGDAAALRIAMESLLEKAFDPQVALQRRTWVESRYSWESTALQLIDIEKNPTLGTRTNEQA